MPIVASVRLRYIAKEYWITSKVKTKTITCILMDLRPRVVDFTTNTLMQLTKQYNYYLCLMWRSNSLNQLMFPLGIH